MSVSCRLIRAVLSLVPSLSCCLIGGSSLSRCLVLVSCWGSSLSHHDAPLKSCTLPTQKDETVQQSGGLNITKKQEIKPEPAEKSLNELEIV